MDPNLPEYPRIRVVKSLDELLTTRQVKRVLPDKHRSFGLAFGRLGDLCRLRRFLLWQGQGFGYGSDR